MPSVSYLPDLAATSRMMSNSSAEIHLCLFLILVGGGGVSSLAVYCFYIFVFSFCFLNINNFFSLAYLTVKIQCIPHITYKYHIISVSLPGNGRLLVAQFEGESEVSGELAGLLLREVAAARPK